MSARCACRCDCPLPREVNTNDLCRRCWGEWCRASEQHRPIADRSYFGTFGLRGLWTPWLMNVASEVLAQPLSHLLTMTAPKCPHVLESGAVCGAMMLARPGAFKCYRHEPWAVIRDTSALTRSPDVDVVEVAR